MSQDSVKSIIITGASGFVGRYLIESLKINYCIYAFARRTQREANVPRQENINWVLVDLANEQQLEQTIEEIKAESSIDFIIHLAAFYDFDNRPDPAYESTNVRGTGLLLEHARHLNIKSFLFASSLVACKYPAPGTVSNEQSPPDAEYPYAVSKRKGEELVREYSQYFPCVTIRFAAVFSDWCEYLPLYFFFRTWLSHRWNSHIIAGRGESALPYIHISCLMKMIAQILDQTEQLSQHELFIASSDRAISHLQLFNLVTRYYYGRNKKPIFIPKILARMGIAIRDIFGRLIGRRPFERLWMVDYIDQVFNSDSSYTREKLDWQPLRRHTLERRLLFMIENLKSSPIEWHQKNTARMISPTGRRPNLVLAEEMINRRNDVIDRVLTYILDKRRANIFRYYQNLEQERVRYYIEVLYNHIISSVRNGDRSLMISFAQVLAHARYNEGVRQSELCGALQVTSEIIDDELKQNPKLKKMEILIHDYIILALQLAIDEVKDTYDHLRL